MAFKTRTEEYNPHMIERDGMIECTASEILESMRKFQQFPMLRQSEEDQWNAQLRDEGEGCSVTIHPFGFASFYCPLHISSKTQK